MPLSSLREVEHEITVPASAENVYRLIAEVENWPRLFPPTIHVERLEQGGADERIQIWALSNGRPASWTSRRTLFPERLSITFRQEVSTPPVAAMGGAWIVEPLADGGCRVRLLHDYRAVEDVPDSLAWIDRAVDGNSRTELEALRANVSRTTRAEAANLLLSFEDSVTFSGRARDAYDFVNEAGLWAQRLPHVASVRLEQAGPGIQDLEMDTRAVDGTTHTTRSFRVTFPHHRIAYKQTTLPALMSLHTGYWTFTEDESGIARACSQHTVIIAEESIAGVLGDEATVEQARDLVQKALRTNSLTTLQHAKEYAEARR